MTKGKKAYGFGPPPSFYGEPTINKGVRISDYTTKDLTRKPKLCGFSCGMMVYKDKITGHWMEESGISHSLKRCSEILEKKRIKNESCK